VEFVIEQRNVDGMEEIELLIEVNGNVAKSPLKRLENKLRDTLHLRIPVRLVESGSLLKAEFKSKRWRRI
jgi:phenylacetate-CoA ligase